MSPYRIYKTLMLRAGQPMTARQVAAAWAVKAERAVRRENEARIESALRVMEKHGTVERVESGWIPLPLPDDPEARKDVLRSIDREWKRVRPPSP